MFIIPLIFLIIFIWADTSYFTATWSS